MEGITRPCVVSGLHVLPCAHDEHINMPSNLLLSFTVIGHPTLLTSMSQDLAACSSVIKYLFNGQSRSDDETMKPSPLGVRPYSFSPGNSKTEK